ncbi:uncharacterized protein LOC115447570 isoform X2 [Manduca sexta]|uniref:uncharacterized protein LOC115447570 isoform X2 n=1 Tax=Manduca sexta TaxID=7130 RepID=UPI00188E2553|nr:uncharacterized protein LOC115447570 isoform X2 [Manduca sexta]
MELVSLAGELLQTAAEHAASYRAGQTALRYLDKTLWVLENSARWAVPTPLDERPQPELVRPLPWIFFLSLLVTLRLTREAISLINLIMGKPPLTSADVVIFIQGKRRYLRTLKYLGCRQMRARTSGGHVPEPWYQRLQSLFEFTMCFRNSRQYGNNNTTSVSNNDEVMVVQRSNGDREEASVAPSASVESTMERLIERMMVDLDADSDEDSGFALTETGATSDKSGNTINSEQDVINQNDAAHNPEPTPETQIPTDKDSNETTFAPIKNGSSTPHEPSPAKEENNVETKQEISPKQELLNFIQNEISHNVQRTPKNTKIGRKLKLWSVTKRFFKHKSKKMEAPTKGETQARP